MACSIERSTAVAMKLVDQCNDVPSNDRDSTDSAEVCTVKISSVLWDRSKKRSNTATGPGVTNLFIDVVKNTEA